MLGKPYSVGRCARFYIWPGDTLLLIYEIWRESRITYSLKKLTSLGLAWNFADIQSVQAGYGDRG